MRRVAVLMTVVALSLGGSQVLRGPLPAEGPQVSRAAVELPGRPAAEHRDVVVYGGTPAGVAAALAATSHSADVVLLAEAGTVGGMASNGISASDVGSPLAVQGIALDFFERIRSYYGDPTTWRFEPRIAERVFRRMLEEAGVDVRLRSPLTGVRTADRTVDCVTVADGDEFCADTFVDASYTGDLIAGAGVRHRVGMADFRAYDEPLAAQRGWTEVLAVEPGEAVSARAAFAANPFVDTADDVPDYDDVVDSGTPSLAYRLCVTVDPGNRTPFRATARYAEFLPSFRLMAGALSGAVETRPNGSLLSDAFQIAVLPGDKYDLNAGHLAFTNVPAPADYFDDPVRRAEHNRTLREYVESFFHFLGRDPAVPAPLREVFAPFGLCADEFADNGNWPYEPYVRDARRIEGRATLTQADVYTDREKTSAVAVGAYHVDTKPTRMLFADGRLVSDGNMLYTAPAYEIPFEVLLPAEGGVVNLLAPVGVSASPTAYGSVRMEPQYMALGEAAGIAAALASTSGTPVASVPVADVQDALRRDGVLFRLRDLCRVTPPQWRGPGGYTAGCDVLPVRPRAL